MYRVAVFVCFYLVQSCSSQNELYEGSVCSVDESEGVCINIKDCKSALQDLRNGKYPQICSFLGLEPVVCCFDKPATPEMEATTRIQWTTSPVPTTPTPSTTVHTPPARPAPPVRPARPTHTARPAPPVLTARPTLPAPTTPPTPPETTTATTILLLNETESKFLGEDVKLEKKSEVLTENVECPPISPNKTTAKTGQKALDKCIEYQEQLVLVCDPTQGKRFNYCRNDLNIWILDGEDAFDGEFPHMALVGYGSDPENLSFLCGGSLISDSFVLTAGHCISARHVGPISHVLLGVLKKSSFNASNLHRVVAVHKHPDYVPPKKYNDIALLQLATPVKLTDLIIPACLDVGDVSEEEVATATGWGKTQFMGNSSDILQKVDLTKFSKEECAQRYPSSRLMQKGLDNTSQICYGDRTKSRDTCQGDSGGPLQVRHKKIYCMYTLIGITSFGRTCGVPGEPALYTRVAHYLPWIEELVWPDPVPDQVSRSGAAARGRTASDAIYFSVD